MNRLWIWALLLLCAAYAATYTVDLDREGTASVALSLNSEETVSVPLPPDASNFRIAGGQYEIINNSAAVISGGFATFSFSTSTLTSKGDAGWSLSVNPPKGARVRILLPPYSMLGNITPQPENVHAEDSRIVVLEAGNGTINAEYSLGAIPLQETDFMPFIAGGALIAALGAAYYLYRGMGTPGGEKKPSLAMTKGKGEMYETFNENDRAIVDFLVSKGGRCRRNELERGSGISKYSLAMALNRLERRKIVEIDRGATTHFVKLADYFLRL